MDIIEYLDEECDAKITFEEMGELGASVLTFSLEDVETKIRIYPEGIEKLRRLLEFLDENNLIHDGTGDIDD